MFLSSMIRQKGHILLDKATTKASSETASDDDALGHHPE